MQNIGGNSMEKEMTNKGKELQKELEVWLASIAEIGPVKARRLLEHFGDEYGIYHARKSALDKVEGISEKDVQAIVSETNKRKAREDFEKMLNRGISFVSIHDKAYPEMLRKIDNPPYGLFVRGKMPAEHIPSVAIVGARNCTNYGKEMSRWFARELSEAGIQIISGLAYGVDGSAHQGALEGKTPTFGVLGCGIDICYPKENFSLYMDMLAHGGILSEYGLGVPGMAYQFPMRNRIISGLCDAIVIVEARQKSGSLITADQALEQGKSIFALPGRIGDPLSVGCMNLIKQGAELVTSPQDILDNFYIDTVIRKKEMGELAGLEQIEEQKIFLCLSFEPKHIDQLARETGFLISKLLTILLKMELDGFVRQTSQNCYIRAL